MGKRTFTYDKVLCKNYGKKIKTLRKNLNMTQDELAFNVKISPSFLSTIERGKSDSSISTAKRIAKSLNVDLYELFL